MAAMAVFSFFVCALAAQGSPAPVTLIPYDDPDAYAIYSLILPQLWPVTVAHAKMLVISSQSAKYDLCIKPGPATQKLLRPALDDYVKQNAQRWEFQRKFTLDLPYELVDPDLIAAYYNDARGWDAFYPHSGGYIMLSAVGFNPDKTIAVLYEGHACGLLCGSGTFHIFQKKDNKWQTFKMDGESCAWIS